MFDNATYITLQSVIKIFLYIVLHKPHWNDLSPGNSTELFCCCKAFLNLLCVYICVCIFQNACAQEELSSIGRRWNHKIELILSVLLMNILH